MPVEFIKCSECSVFFPKDEKGSTACPKCRNEPMEFSGPKDKLRHLKNILRDNAAKGNMLTIPQLSEISQIGDTVIWEFINSGQLDVASFSDPEVRDFVVKRRREKLKEAQSRVAQPVSSEPEPTKKHSGFHKRVDS